MTISVKIMNHDGVEWDVSEITHGFTWKTSRMGSAGSLSFSLLKTLYDESAQFNYHLGNVVQVRINDINLFHGYIFSIDEGRGESSSITAYDQIRYLMNTQTYVFNGVTASQIVKKIAQDFNLKHGYLEDTKYIIPTMSEDGQKLLDIICKAITITYSNLGQDYCLYDLFGELQLRRIDDWGLDLVLGDESLVYDYSLKSSIDSDTYNRIKLYQDNKKTGRREVYMAQDSVNIARWGVLQYYESVDEQANEAQIKQLLDNLSKLKNRVTKSFTLNAIGDPRIRAGMRVRIKLKEYKIDQSLLVDECTHQFSGGDHTMSLELKVL